MEANDTIPLELTSTVIAKDDNGSYPFHVIGFLIPHEMLRREMRRAELALQELDSIRLPWKAKAFKEWIVDFFVPLMHTHHYIEDNIIFPFYLSLNCVTPDRHSDDHITLFGRLNRVKLTVEKLVKLIDEYEKYYSLIVPNGNGNGTGSGGVMSGSHSPSRNSHPNYPPSNSPTKTVNGGNSNKSNNGGSASSGSNRSLSSPDLGTIPSAEISGIDPVKEHEIRSLEDNLRTEFVTMANHIRDHFREEEEFWPPLLLKCGEVRYSYEFCAS